MTARKPLPVDLIDALLADYKKPEDLIGEEGLLKQLTKALVERALNAEMTDHLGHSKHAPVANPTGNTRNGKSRKTLKGDFGDLPIEVPRDRLGTFEPQLIGKHQTRWTGFDDKILSLYARGMTVREIQAHLMDMYGTEVSPTLISTVTDAVMEDVKAWQSRPLEALYPIVYLDCIHVKVRDSGAVRVKAVYLALGLSHMASKNVRVDSLFLDEGFGTLDEEALDTALETLAGLQQDGKLIGVISHVPALKERISTQIQVSPQTGGRSQISGPGCGSVAPV